MAGKGWGPRDPDSLRRFVYEQIPYYQFHSVPGALHLYSNTAICIVGHVAEAVTGRFYDDLVQETVFDPLDMMKSTYDPAVALTYPLALPHSSGQGGEPQVIHRMTVNASGNPSSFCYGSASDLAQLARMYLCQGLYGGQRFLTAASIAEMQRPYGSSHVEGADHPITRAYQGYGLGFMVGEYKGHRIARHSGMSLSYNCFFDLFPDDGAGVVLLTNYGQEDPILELWATCCDIALGLPQEGVVLVNKPAVLSPLDAEQLQEYVGAYLHVASGDLAAVAVVEGELVLERQGAAMSLVRFGRDQFYGVHAEGRHMPVAFLRDSEGEIAHAMVIGQPYHCVELDAAFEPDPCQWRSFKGVYKDPSNSNPEEMLTVRLRGNELSVVKGDREAPCRAIGSDYFVCDHSLIEFEATDSDEAKVLVWGKATRYYPLDERAYRQNQIVRYLVEAPGG
jgi:hypothetical protein